MMKAKGKILLGAEILSNSYLCKCKYPEQTENNKSGALGRENYPI